MSHGEYLLSKACAKCGRVGCIQCMIRTCLNCKRIFIDHDNHRDVEMITNTGVCVECGLLLTQRYMAGALEAHAYKYQEAHAPDDKDSSLGQTA